MKSASVLVALSGFLASAACAVTKVTTSSCRCLPGDACWPSAATWASLNSTVGGRLVATTPIGSPCHDPNYDADACAALQASWTSPSTHIDSSSSPMEPYFANQTCDPFTDRTIPCTLGNLVSYAVNVTNAADIQAALKFAKAQNIRVVIRNTGHDFLGRSTGAGALSIWTHHLQSIDFITWNDPQGYQGPAVKIGSGVIGYQIVEAAHAAGYVVVGGECPTVGLAGGYIQGGGHSALSSSFGLAADSALEFEVVLANGSIVTANRKTNSDLFWALRGGGGGTFGVVLHATIAVYPEETVGGGYVATSSAYTTTENWAKLIEGFHALLPNMTEAGASIVYYISNSIFAIRPVTVYGKNETYVKDVVLAPLVSLLSELSIPASVKYTTLSYRDHYDTYMGPLPEGWISIATYNFGGRLIPTAVLKDEQKVANFSSALGQLLDGGVLAVGTAANFGVKSNDIAAHPAWRTTSVQMQLTTAWTNTASWTANVAGQTQMTDTFMPIIEAATPGGGSYLNEADFNQPNWQDTFFGSNYPKLQAIKSKYDPDSLFYILKGVGSEKWSVANNGRMCKA